MATRSVPIWPNCCRTCPSELSVVSYQLSERGQRLTRALPDLVQAPGRRRTPFSPVLSRTPILPLRQGTVIRIQQRAQLGRDFLLRGRGDAPQIVLMWPRLVDRGPCGR